MPDYELHYIPEPNCGCWIWIRAIDRHGYGRMNLGGKNRPAHRFFYEGKFGKVPEGLELDHKCKVKGCVNPDHLEAVTHKENVMRGTGVGVVNKAKTHCPKGHEYTADNIYFDNGRRRCKVCTLARKRKTYNARK